jgi:hypothetical protein
MKIKNSVMMIQKGLLFRCKDEQCVKAGVKRIKKVLHTIEKVDPKDFLDEEQVHAQCTSCHLRLRK